MQTVKQLQNILMTHFARMKCLLLLLLHSYGCHFQHVCVCVSRVLHGIYCLLPFCPHVSVFFFARVCRYVDADTQVPVSVWEATEHVRNAIRR